MTKKVTGLFIIALMLLVSCGGEKSKKDTPTKVESQQEVKKEVVKEEAKAEKVASNKPSERIDLKNKGIGPIKSVTLDTEINQEMVTQGADVFKRMCTACHRANKKFIGPSPQNILERRTPEWIMNMILNPVEMVSKDPLAKDLLMEFNGSPMANQNLTEDEARAVLEYYRTLK